MRPWETPIGTRPWEVAAMPLFDRVVTFKRPPGDTGSGLLPYQGTTEASETLVVAGIIANIEISSAGRNSQSAGGLPGDAPGPIKFTITLPPSVMATVPLIMEEDLVYDDLGRRFQVSAYQPENLGARIDCVRKLA